MFTFALSGNLIILYSMQSVSKERAIITAIIFRLRLSTGCKLTFISGAPPLMVDL